MANGVIIKKYLATDKIIKRVNVRISNKMELYE